MRWRIAIGATVATVILGIFIGRWALQSPSVLSVEETILREYVGAYQWDPNAFVYLQMWNESGTNQLVAFDESGEVRTLYPTDRDRFFTGPGVSVPTAIESRVDFQRDGAGTITSLTWQRESASPRIARRVEIDKREDVSLMKLQYRFAGAGEGWDEYAASRQNLAAQMGAPPDTFPGTADDPYWQFIRRLYFYDPAPTLQQLQVPILALFGELDNNILAEKNKTAWEAALEAGGNRDYTLQILPKANHLMLEAEVGSNAEMASLQRVVPGLLRNYPRLASEADPRVRRPG